MPAGMEFVDVEEEYIVDESGYGSWQPATEKPHESPDQPTKKRAKKAKSSQEASVPKPEAGPSADVEEI